MAVIRQRGEMDPGKAQKRNQGVSTQLEGSRGGEGFRGRRRAAGGEDFGDAVSIHISRSKDPSHIPQDIREVITKIVSKMDRQAA